MKTLNLIANILAVVAVLAIAWAFLAALPEPARKPEPCVEVGKFDNSDRVIVVCDEEAVRRWAR